MAPGGWSAAANCFRTGSSRRCTVQSTRTAGLKDSHCNICAGFGISEGVVMVQKVISTGCRNGLELMVGEKSAKMMPGGPEGIIKNVVRVVHLVNPEDRFEAALVEGSMMGNQGKTFDQGYDLLPYIREYRCILRIFGSESMDFLAEPLVMLRFRTD